MSKTTFKNFCDYVLESGGDYKSGFTVGSDGRMISYVVLYPKPESDGIPCMFENVEPDDIMSQKVILSAKRRLKLYEA